jgi:predicted permease
VHWEVQPYDEAIAGGAMARAWFTAIAILIAGLALGDDVGLSAILLVLVLFTVYFATKTFERMIAPDGGSA